MKRPHSAKPMRNFIPQVISEEGGTLDQPRHFIKGGGKRHMLSAVSVATDLSRLLPKKIQHDKQQLYHENLQLKSSLNEITEENLKLKTKVALFQREKDRLHKTDNYTGATGKSSNNLNAGSKGEKENGVVNGLKKLLRQTRQENDALKAEVARLKKSIRHTKINEMQIEKQTIYDQNKKLAKLVQKYEEQLTSRIREERDVERLEAELNQKRRILKEVTADNIKYEEILEEVQEQCREASQKLLIQEKKWQRNFAVQKRRCEQLNKHVEALRAEVKSLNETLQQQRKKMQLQKKPVRPVSSHPYQISVDGPKDKDMKEKQAAIQANSRLRQQLEEAKKKLAASQNRLKDTAKDTGNLLLVTKNEPFELNLTKEDPNRQEEEYYGSDFQETKGQQQPSPPKPKEKAKTKSQTGAKLSPIMNQIKELLTYRLKYNRYTFQELKQDIEVSPDSAFLYEDLMAMLLAEPFYLTPKLATNFLRNCYGRQDVHNDDELDLHDLIDHLRLVVEDFELRDQEEEEQMLYHIADNLTKNRKKLEDELNKLGGKNGCVSKDQLTKLLRAVSKLSEEEIELAICYISINTDSLQSIGYVDFLDRFFIAKSKSQIHPKPDDDLSLGDNEHLDEGQLIADDELI